MTKSRFNLRNVATIVACLAVCMMFASCKNNKDNGGAGSNKLSPPAWIQGKWGAEGVEVYRFTSDDIFISGISFKFTFPNVPGVTHTFKETKTDALYEVTVTQTAGKTQSEAAKFSFKKGDGTYIDFAAAYEDENITPDAYARLSKMN